MRTAVSADHCDTSGIARSANQKGVRGEQQCRMWMMSSARTECDPTPFHEWIIAAASRQALSINSVDLSMKVVSNRLSANFAKAGRNGF